ncbi:hypothetical protein [Subtercola lobariae]|uniref:Uncharacterized protein n=1 Tax=Subtercola lobariae TaxID=1588641 RepID=A0A917B7F1_9MICO|nr:hypothetical protein [Subtercola lobariae]GGF29705.1 hypothetical protein GCM10011399_23570 [Subtercola lobariae]
MKLEGDFPNYFDVYCTPGSERDALYILTPDLMASLADNAGFSSMEITDNALIFFTPGGFDPEDPAQWRRCFRLLHSVGKDALKRTQRFNRVDLTESGQSMQPEIHSHKRLTLSTGRSNRSTQLVEAACALVVVAVFLWAWLH